MSEYIYVGEGKVHVFGSPKRDVLTPEKIARALSRTPRFRGLTPEFYSVAQHSVIVSQHLEKFGLAREGLMHELDEFEWGDIPTPRKKRSKAQAMIDVDTKSMMVLYDIKFPLNALVHTYDKMAYLTECRDVWDNSPILTDCYTGYFPFDEKIVPVSMDEAYGMFVRQFYKVFK